MRKIPWKDIRALIYSTIAAIIGILFQSPQ